MRSIPMSGAVVTERPDCRTATSPVVKVRAKRPKPHK